MRKLNYARFILLLVLTLGLNACGGDDVYYTDDYLRNLLPGMMVKDRENSL